jgi:hypothetical protein
MTRKQRQMLFIVEEWKKNTGKTEIDMHEVAAYAHKKGWPLPPQISGLDRLAKEFSRAAREETRTDSKTGESYRVYHAYPKEGGGQGDFRWMDIDEAPRKVMHKSTTMRREQVVGDMVQLTLDLKHWNRINPSEEPIVLVSDLTEDINERLSGGEEGLAA